MKEELEVFFVSNTDATYKKQDGKLCLVSADNDMRVQKAKQQYTILPVHISSIIAYVSEFLNMISGNDYSDRPKLGSIRIDGNNHTVIDRDIVINGCEWQPPVFDKAKN